MHAKRKDGSTDTENKEKIEQFKPLFDKKFKTNWSCWVDHDNETHETIDICPKIRYTRNVTLFLARLFFLYHIQWSLFTWIYETTSNFAPCALVAEVAITFTRVKNYVFSRMAKKALEYVQKQMKSLWNVKYPIEPQARKNKMKS